MPRNQRTTALITFSLERPLATKAEKFRKATHRTRSELMRDALRTFLDLAQRPAERATPTDLRAIQRGRRAVARGDFVTLDQLRHELAKLGTHSRRPRSEKSPARSRR